MKKPYSIETFPDMSVLHTDESMYPTRDSLIRHERRTYGFEKTGYGEYLFCTKSECGRIQSIEEAYGLTDSPEGYDELVKIEESGETTPCCPDCQSPTLLLFDERYFGLYLAEIHRGTYGAILKDEANEVQGASIVQPGNLTDDFDTAINYAGTYDINAVRQNIEGVLGRTFSTGKDNMTFWNRMSVVQGWRGGSAFMDMANANLGITDKYDGLPCMGSTKQTSAALPIFKSSGTVEIVAEDEIGGVLLLNPKLKDMKDYYALPAEEKRKLYGAYKKQIVEEQPPVSKSEPAYYNTPEVTPLLDAFKQIHAESSQK